MTTTVQKRYDELVPGDRIVLCRDKTSGREWTKRQPTPIPGERITA